MIEMVVYCCECGKEIVARLTDGAEIYPHRPDLSDLPFWKCNECGNYVGCHHKTKSRIRPLGCIPSPKIRSARKQIHALLDPLWKSGKMKRGAVYQVLSEALGRKYHTAELRTIREAVIIYKTLEKLTEDHK